MRSTIALLHDRIQVLEQGNDDLCWKIERENNRSRELEKSLSLANTLAELLEAKLTISCERVLQVLSPESWNKLREGEGDPLYRAKLEQMVAADVSAAAELLRDFPSIQKELEESLLQLRRVEKEVKEKEAELWRMSMLVNQKNSQV